MPTPPKDPNATQRKALATVRTGAAALGLLGLCAVCAIVPILGIAGAAGVAGVLGSSAGIIALMLVIGGVVLFVRARRQRTCAVPTPGPSATHDDQAA